jgi:Holliday junction resolvase RusA-like endonuclease
MVINLDIKPLSVNEAWKGRRYKTDKYKKFESDVLFLLPKAKEKMPDMIALDIHFGFKNLRSDIDNPAKLIIDILQKKYGFDDSQVFELNLRKSVTKMPFIHILIRPLLPFTPTV